MTSTRKLESQLDRIRSEETMRLCFGTGYADTPQGRVSFRGNAIETLRNEIPALADYLIRKSTAR